MINKDKNPEIEKLMKLILILEKKIKLQERKANELQIKVEELEHKIAFFNRRLK